MGICEDAENTFLGYLRDSSRVATRVGADKSVRITVDQIGVDKSVRITVDQVGADKSVRITVDQIGADKSVRITVDQIGADKSVRITVDQFLVSVRLSIVEARSQPKSLLNTSNRPVILLGPMAVTPSHK